MSTEETPTKRKISAQKAIVIILSLVLITSMIAGIALYREHKLRRAVVSFEGVSFDGMLFEPCTNYELTKNLDISKLICKSKDGNQRIYSAKGYEVTFEYIRVQSLINGSWYKRVE